jgi:hypothetical protein
MREPNESTRLRVRINFLNLSLQRHKVRKPVGSKYCDRTGGIMRLMLHLVAHSLKFNM